jgi:hypothetical protein
LWVHEEIVMVALVVLLLIPEPFVAAGTDDGEWRSLKGVQMKRDNKHTDPRTDPREPVSDLRDDPPGAVSNQNSEDGPIELREDGKHPEPRTKASTRHGEVRWRR